MTYDDEIVTYPDMSKSEEEIQRQLDENTAAKLRHAARREQERFDRPGIFARAKAKLKALLAHKQATQMQSHSDKQR
ncbi:MAG: hypothetical protein K2L95_02575 [Alphaproteobacteria bacterium]|nr:hypothetical protein [Alphaproteobacteria bacterium]MDE6571080.1 hypothetical protein [Alphaproteobacteria bacterium]